MIIKRCSYLGASANVSRAINWKLISFLHSFFLARFASHHQHIICYRRVTTTSWYWRTCKATWRCRFHPWWSLNTPTKSSQAVGIQQISHSCQHPLIKLRNCGRCRPFKQMQFGVIFNFFVFFISSIKSQKFYFVDQKRSAIDFLFLLLYHKTRRSNFNTHCR